MNEKRIDGFPLPLRVSHAGLWALEKELGRGVGSIINDLSEGNVPYSAIVAIIWALSFSGGKESMSIDQVGEIVIEQGIEKMVPAIEVFAEGLSGGSKKKDPATLGS